jgi:hypothetical protein
MDILSERIKRLPASATLTMAAKARELKNKGIDVIGLSLVNQILIPQNLLRMQQ